MYVALSIIFHYHTDKILGVHLVKYFKKYYNVKSNNIQSKIGLSKLINL